MKKHKHYISIFIEGVETEVPVIIKYDFQPAEISDRFYPGCDAKVTITSVKFISGFDLMELAVFADGARFHELERVILADIDNVEESRMAA